MIFANRQMKMHFMLQDSLSLLIDGQNAEMQCESATEIGYLSGG